MYDFIDVFLIPVTADYTLEIQTLESILWME